MSDREFENYLALLTGMLRLRRTQREGISGELRDHLIEHVAHLEATGITHEEAVRRALEEFGDAAALAANFSALVGMRRRRLIMRCTIGTTVVMTGLVIAMLAFRPEVVNDPGLAQAQDTAKDDAAKDGAAKDGAAKDGAAKDGAAKDDAGSAQPAKPKEKAVVGPGGKSHNEVANEATLQKLDALISVAYTETPLGIALEAFSNQIGAQFHLDPKALVDLAITQDDPVTLGLKQVPAEMVLDLMLRPMQLSYTLRNGVIMVSSQAELDARPETRVYHVPAHSTEELTKLITSMLEPTSWDHAGGLGAIRPFRDSLVVSQTWQVHREIDNLLKDLEPVLAKAPVKAAQEHATDGGYGSAGGRYDGGGYGAPAGRIQPGYGADSSTPGYGASSPQSGYGAPGGRNRRANNAELGYGAEAGGGGYGAASGGGGGGYGAASSAAGYGRPGGGYGRSSNRSAPAAEGKDDIVEPDRKTAPKAENAGGKR